MKPSAHLHLIVQATIKNPPQEHECEKVSNFMNDMVDHVRMRVMIPPATAWCADAGNEGITSIVVLTTSHAVVHIWNMPEPYDSKFEFDLYSCSAFTPEEVIAKIQESWDVTSIYYKFLDRENNLQELASGKINFSEGN